MCLARTVPGAALTCRLERTPKNHKGAKATIGEQRRTVEKWSGRPDSNWRPPAPKAGALPGCATPRRQALSHVLRAMCYVRRAHVRRAHVRRASRATCYTCFHVLTCDSGCPSPLRSRVRSSPPSARHQPDIVPRPGEDGCDQRAADFVAADHRGRPVAGEHAGLVHASVHGSGRAPGTWACLNSYGSRASTGCR